jgi:hypothetical protein
MRDTLAGPVSDKGSRVGGGEVEPRSEAPEVEGDIPGRGKKRLADA